MQSSSSESVRVFWLDSAAIRGRLAGAAHRLAEARPEVERVILFGSLARGDAAPGSDADLLVVLSSAERPFLSRIPDYGLIHCGISVDVFPYTEDELAQKLAASPRWAAAIRDGITLFERTPQPHPATRSERRSSAR